MSIQTPVLFILPGITVLASRYHSYIFQANTQLPGIIRIPSARSDPNGPFDLLAFYLLLVLKPASSDSLPEKEICGY
jgi:hypothetical protein